MGDVGRTVTNAMGLNAVTAPFAGAARKALPQPKQQAQPMTQEQMLIDKLSKKALGEGPFISDIQKEQDLARTQGQALGFASSLRGVSPAQAARMATSALGQSQAQVIGEAGQQRLAEQEAATMGALGAFDVQAQRGLAGQQLKQQRRAQEQATMGSLLGGLGAAGILAFSDENVKTEIKDGSKSINKFLNALNASDYKYKSEKYGEKGQHTSVMAQELEKSEIGKKMVIDTPQGKVVDYAKGLPAMLAAQAELNKRLKKLEESKVQKFYKGGKVKKMADGGKVPNYNTSFYKQLMSQGLDVKSAVPQMSTAQMLGIKDAMSSLGSAPMQVQDNPSMDTIQQPRQDFINRAMPMFNEGGYVVDGKAKVKGDSEKNDVVPALLSPGEIVVPRSMAKKDPKKIAEFIKKVQEKEME